MGEPCEPSEGEGMASLWRFYTEVTAALAAPVTATASPSLSCFHLIVL